MEKIAICRTGLRELSSKELEMKGGVTWDQVVKVFRVVKKVINFINDYKDDIRKGFEKGWRML